MKRTPEQERETAMELDWKALVAEAWALQLERFGAKGAEMYRQVADILSDMAAERRSSASDA